MATRITLIEGSSTAPDTDGSGAAQHRAGRDGAGGPRQQPQPRARRRPSSTCYAPLVSPGSYIVACDGIMAQVAGAPRTAPDWTWNNPISAVDAFLTRNPDFVLEEPAFAFNEGVVRNRVTYWPKCFLSGV